MRYYVFVCLPAPPPPLLNIILLNNMFTFIFRCFLSVYLLSDLGAAYGTAKSGVGVSSVGVMRPDLIMRSILPVIMAGILGIYGLIISIVISSVSTLTPLSNTIGYYYPSSPPCSHPNSPCPCYDKQKNNSRIHAQTGCDCSRN